MVAYGMTRLARLICDTSLDIPELTEKSPHPFPSVRNPDCHLQALEFSAFIPKVNILGTLLGRASILAR